MIRETKVIILFLIVFKGNLFSQDLSHQVLVPVAGIAYSSGLSYSQTIGETAVVIINSYDYVLTQGFQQPLVKISKSLPPPGNGVKVYPNPVTDILNIEFFGQKDRTFRIELVTISGIKVMSEKRVFNGQFWDTIINRTFKIDIM
jgi:hypothetical protein